MHFISLDNPQKSLSVILYYKIIQIQMMLDWHECHNNHNAKTLEPMKQNVNNITLGLIYIYSLVYLCVYTVCPMNVLLCVCVCVCD